MLLSVNRIVVPESKLAIFETATIPIPPTHDIIIQVGLCGICTSEQRVFKGTSRQQYPYWGGHELFGIVVEKIKEVAGVNIGDTVALSLMNRCGSCKYCARRLDNHCAYCNHVDDYHDGFSGPRGFSSFMSLSMAKAFPVSGSIPPAQLTFIEPTACAMRSVEVGSPLRAEVGVIGCGTMGLIHAIVLKSKGHSVHMFEDDNSDLLKAQSLDLSGLWPTRLLETDEINRITAGRGISTFFCTRYGIDGVQRALRCVDRGGAVVLFQSVLEMANMEVDITALHYHETRLVGAIAHTRQNFQDAIAFMSAHFGLFSVLTTEIISAAAPQHALERSLGRDLNRVLIEF